MLVISHVYVVILTTLILLNIFKHVQPCWDLRNTEVIQVQAPLKHTLYPIQKCGPDLEDQLTID